MINRHDPSFPTPTSDGVWVGSLESYSVENASEVPSLGDLMPDDLRLG